MRAIVYDKPCNPRVVEIPKPKCGKKQVIINVKSCGICKGADLALHEGRFLAKFPLTPGHEFAGIIDEVGAEVKNFRKGDRVVGDNAVNCGECYYCMRNQPLFCKNFYSLGCNAPGGYAEYVLIDACKTFPISDRLSFDEACLAEPVACAVHAMDVLDVAFGDHVLVFGAGPTGIILTQLLHASGASRVVSVAPTESKLNILKDLGAAETVLMDRNNYAPHEGILNGMEPEGFDVVVDTTGSSRILEHGMKFLKKGGKALIFALSENGQNVQVNPTEFFMKELTLLASNSQIDCFPRAVDFLEKGIVKVDRLVTHHLRLEEYEKGLELVRKGGSACLKVLVHPDKKA